MRGAEGVVVRDLIHDDGLGIELTVAAGEAGLYRVVRSTRIQKSGLALTGHFHGIEPGRIQILGMTELTYLKQLPEAQCHDSVRQLFERELCCVIVTECDQAMDDSTAAGALVDCADEYDVPLLLSPERSSRTIVALHALLDERLAPRARIHGVLVDVFEVGVLLLGSSGVGKSEVALELVMRGHRLVADDVVECHYRPPGMVFGAPADLLRHHLEVRGLGILNIKDLFGVTSVRERKRIDVVIRLMEQAIEGHYDRLGLEQRHHDVLGVEIPELLIPVRPGRDMASILEIAARNYLLKAAGHHPAREFFGRLHGALMGAESEIPPGVADSPLAQFGADAVSLQVPGHPPSRGAGSRLPKINPPPESSVGMPRTAGKQTSSKK